MTHHTSANLTIIDVESNPTTKFNSDVSIVSIEEAKFPTIIKNFKKKKNRTESKLLKGLKKLDSQPKRRNLRQTWGIFCERNSPVVFRQRLKSSASRK